MASLVLATSASYGANLYLGVFPVVDRDQSLLQTVSIAKLDTRVAVERASAAFGISPKSLADASRSIGTVICPGDRYFNRTCSQRAHGREVPELPPAVFGVPRCLSDGRWFDEDVSTWRDRRGHAALNAIARAGYPPGTSRVNKAGRFTSTRPARSFSSSSRDRIAEPRGALAGGSVPGMDAVPSRVEVGRAAGAVAGAHAAAICDDGFFSKKSASASLIRCCTGTALCPASISS